MSGSRRPAKVIEVRPDAAALLAQRLTRRLQRDGLIPPTWKRGQVDALVEALADEIHEDILDCTLRLGER